MNHMSGGEAIIYHELKDAYLRVWEATGRVPTEIVVTREPYKETEDRQKAVVTEEAWRECVRAFLRDSFQAEPTDWEVERHMRVEARFLGVLVNTSSLSPLGE